jgi:hypothetical protein
LAITGILITKPKLLFHSLIGRQLTIAVFSHFYLFLVESNHLHLQVEEPTDDVIEEQNKDETIEESDHDSFHLYDLSQIYWFNLTNWINPVY